MTLRAIDTSKRRGLRLGVALLPVIVLLASAPCLAQEAGATEQGGEITLGVQGTTVDAEDDLDGQFETYRDEPDGFVVDDFRLWTSSDRGYVLVEGRDGMQADEAYLLRAGWGKLGLRFEYTGIPYVYGNGAVFALDRSGNVFRMPDFVQRQLQDPDGDGVPFFAESGGLFNEDNLRVQELMRQYLSARDPFDLESRRRRGGVELDYAGGGPWSFGLTAARDEKNGTSAHGKGTYQRVVEGYDYIFSMRGIELPTPIDSTTDRVQSWVQLRQAKWYGRVDLSISRFDNEVTSVVYDNAFWFDDLLAASGSQRGLWQQGDSSLFPDNEAWKVAFTGGFDLPARTKVTLHASRGENSQDEDFLPITRNTALIGTVDINGDGVVDAADDPTSLALLPRRSLDATDDITVFSLKVTSRPTDRLQLEGRLYSYDYSGGDRRLLLPVRAEYNNSRLVPDFHHADLIVGSADFTREEIAFQGAFTVTDAVKVIAFAKRTSRDFPQYVDRDPGTFDKEAGFRAVEGTDDDTLGASLLLDLGPRTSARVTLSASERTFQGDYQVAFDGELEEVRQFDIADRDRLALEAELSFVPSDRWTAGIGYRFEDDDYDAVYGLDQEELQGIDLHASYAISEQASLFASADWTTSDSLMHLRTKCANCPPPPGATWTAPWEVPNFDWLSEYDEETVSLALGGDFRSRNGRHRLEAEIAWFEGTIEQDTRNPGLPVDLLAPGRPVAEVALGYPFPDQKSTLLGGELSYTRRLTDDWSVGLGYRYEDWGLDDFQIDVLEPYGASFLSVDDATRYLLLGARIGDYTAHLGHVFLKLSL